MRDFPLVFWAISPLLWYKTSILTSQQQLESPATFYTFLPTSKSSDSPENNLNFKWHSVWSCPWLVLLCLLGPYPAIQSAEHVKRKKTRPWGTPEFLLLVQRVWRWAGRCNQRWHMAKPSPVLLGRLHKDHYHIILACVILLFVSEDILWELSELTKVGDDLMIFFKIKSRQGRQWWEVNSHKVSGSY